MYATAHGQRLDTNQAYNTEVGRRRHRGAKDVSGKGAPDHSVNGEPRKT